jgi:hypothetical protein
MTRMDVNDSDESVRVIMKQVRDAKQLREATGRVVGRGTATDEEDGGAQRKMKKCRCSNHLQSRYSALSSATMTRITSEPWTLVIVTRLVTRAS